MKRIEFRLTMPGVGSWNGKWSGEDKDYLIYRTLGDATTDSFMLGRSESSFRHNFGDGWAARVTARVMNDGERKRSPPDFVATSGWWRILFHMARRKNQRSWWRPNDADCEGGGGRNRCS